MHNHNFANAAVEHDIVELGFEELDQVAGAGIGIEWGTATGVATALGVGAAALTAAPLIAGALAAGSIAASAMALYYGAQDEE